MKIKENFIIINKPARSNFRDKFEDSHKRFDRTGSVKIKKNLSYY